ncbi:MAG: DUF499 domain-containing protein [Candidatus Dormibacteraeota bacterium]|uniref:DUF499 domain-containing protein n=1 Tax=Candidatus Amunia macphersoniae TaxID=3127014 RepID=A0A934N8P6_9BACT|nr:DUF499 domain-containing protein [Candidatus Dormibacteraeota bacterium]
MATSNRDRIGKALELLAVGLAPFVDGQMRASTPNGADWMATVAAAGPAPGRKVSITDPQFQLKVLWDFWNPVFSKVLGRSERTMISLLRDARDRWAHNEGFNTDDAYRALDASQALLSAVSAAEQADEVGRAKEEILRQRYEEAARKAARTPTAVGAPTGALAPWREVVTPHSDVAAGTFAQAEFAADLAQVYRGDGAAEYVDPVEFFRRTYLTDGLRQLLTQAAQRLVGHGGVPVVDLQTNFGGGKTHSLLALYHLFSGLPLDRLPQETQDLVRTAGLDKLPQVHRAVLVGTAIAPGQPVIKPDGTEVRTLWGELAWQLGGRDGYALVAEADRTGTNPGAALGELFRANGPALILIDEWVAYARQLYSRDDLPAGSFDAHFSFAQALTEAARATPGTLVVISIPASDPTSGEAGSGIEVGGVGGREALARLRIVVGRMESAWRPASAEESFEIVRRRLFEPLTDPARYAARDATARAFGELYRLESREFPPECREPRYVDRIKAAYPIHPELFARLYEDWSALERFQRTRGVLRLMAAVIHSLWHRGDRSALILPGSVPLDDSTVLAELTHYLEDNWKPIVDADIDGDGSLPAELDRENQTLGRYFAARRVARTVFLGSAPTLRSANRGLEDRGVRLGCVYPGETIGTYADALRRLTDRATYMYVDGTRYWYDTQPSVTRIARDRAARYSERPGDEISVELLRRLRDDSTGRGQRGEFAAVHVAPTSSGEVADDDQVRLVIFGPDTAHIPRSGESSALRAATDIVERRGSSPRLYRNMVVFLAPDHRRLEELLQATAEYVAWDSIRKEKAQLNLDPFQENQVETKVGHSDQAVRLRMTEAFHWMLVPTQPDPRGSIGFDTVRLNGAGGLATRASMKLVNDNHLNVVYTPVLLRLELDRVPLWQGDHVTVAEVWEHLARYVYLPRLRDRVVLEQAVASGPHQLLGDTEGFALAERYDEATHRYVGLVPLGTGSRGEAIVTGTTLLVKPVAATRQLQEAAIERTATTATPTGPLETITATGEVQDRADVAAPTRPHRFHGTAGLDPRRANRDFATLTAELIEHLTRLVEAEIEVTVEIEATSEAGFDDDLVRTVSENARTLHLRTYGFEQR